MSIVTPKLKKMIEVEYNHCILLKNLNGHYALIDDIAEAMCCESDEIYTKLALLQKRRRETFRQFTAKVQTKSEYS